LIRFEKVRYKNLLSSGNAWTQIILNQHKTTLITGTNGVGKSTILDAVTFGLYGKPFRNIRKPQLVNSINAKGLIVEVYFKIKNDSFLVRRGIKPNIFEIFKNGEMVNQSSTVKDYQTYLEETVLKLSHRSFGQIVILGSASFVPFMQLPAQARREVIEDLLDIQVFTTMNILLKERISENKVSLVEGKFKVENLADKIALIEENIESIKKIRQTAVCELNDKKSGYLSVVEEESSIKENILSNIDRLSKTIEDDEKNTKSLLDTNSVLSKLQSKRKSLIKESSFYSNNDNCPSCKQEITEDFKTNILHEKSCKVSEIDNAIAECESMVEKYTKRKSEIDEVKSEVVQLTRDASASTSTINFNLQLIESIDIELEKANVSIKEIDASSVNALKNELENETHYLKSLTEDRELYSVVSLMLKDGGIKTKIVRQYIPIMNKLINKYLAAMDFFVQFELDDNFNETIKSRFRDDFSYASFSEGEKARIDLALLLTWRAVSRLRNSVSTNLLIMDEVFDGSLDAEGTNNLLDIMTELTYDTNLIVISHKSEQMQDKFDRHLRITKEKNFSVVNE